MILSSDTLILPESKSGIFHKAKSIVSREHVELFLLLFLFFSMLILQLTRKFRQTKTKGDNSQKSECAKSDRDGY